MWRRGSGWMNYIDGPRNRISSARGRENASNGRLKSVLRTARGRL
jgi:hypothetical protein